MIDSNCLLTNRQKMSIMFCMGGENMKKSIALILLLIITLFSFSGCGESKATDDNTQEPSSSITESNQIESSVDTTSASNNTVSTSFKATMDEYEKFFNDYVEFMKKYKSASAADLASMMKDYSDYMTKYASYYSKLNSVDKTKLNTADLVYYTEVNARILEKLAEIV